MSYSSSYRRHSGPGVLASGAIGALAGIALVGGLLALLALPGAVQSADHDPASTVSYQL